MLFRSEDASDPGILEKLRNQPLCSGSEPLPCATSNVVVSPLWTLNKWKRGSCDAAEKSAIAMMSRWVIRALCSPKAALAFVKSSGRTTQACAARAATGFNSAPHSPNAPAPSATDFRIFRRLRSCIVSMYDDEGFTKSYDCAVRREK